MHPAVDDHRFMAAAIRLARKHEGWTATNPSVACLLVKDEGHGPVVIGSGVTAIGGRPHAEPLALAQAGGRASGCTAYVTLEPCAHHGRTPPCAQTLIDAGVSRVVTAVIDPDERVNEKGHAMLRAAGIEVLAGICPGEARIGLDAYLVKKRLGRPFVTLKLAVSADGLIGLHGQGQVAITGEIARAQSHLMRARHHAILIGSGTALADDPELTCRLPGLASRSPVRVVLDAHGRLHEGLALLKSAASVPLLAVSPPGLANHPELKAAGAELLACEMVEGRVALPELLDDLGARGIMNVLVEGGAQVAASFLSEDLVDAVALFTAGKSIGEGHAVERRIVSPLSAAAMPQGFHLTGSWRFGDDALHTFTRKR
jgi:diaminohydroxyphosphoribosylaminopyrimidine deaminase/5-amino-6-(5-phosphoribosylamino)uracil reductase